MRNKVGDTAPVVGAVGAPRPAPVAAPARAAAPVQEPALVRLVIEEDQATGAFIYKTLDRLTGEVIRQLPREEVLETLRLGQYEAGHVVKTRV